MRVVYYVKLYINSLLSNIHLSFYTVYLSFQYISNAGKTPHAEVNNILSVTDKIGVLSQQFPKTTGDNVLYIQYDKSYNIGLLPTGVFTVQVSGILSSGAKFTENLQVSVDTANQKVIVIIRPNLTTFTGKMLPASMSRLYAA